MIMEVDMKTAKNTLKKDLSTDDKFLASLFANDNTPVEISGQDWINIIRRGLPVSTISTLAKKFEVTQKDLSIWLHTTPRTIQRSAESNSVLGVEMSDRLAQLIKVYQRGLEVFGERKKVTTWLKSSNYALGGAVPAELLDTIPGIELVLDELGRIEHGVFI
jgi:putative toxin-antitoxin system antitoxin component (TIGR02293 family)